MISYLEAISRDFLIASDERVSLQCDIIFGGDPCKPFQTSAGRSLRKLSLLNDICQNFGRSGPSNMKFDWYGLTSLYKEFQQDKRLPIYMELAIRRIKNFLSYPEHCQYPCLILANQIASLCLLNEVSTCSCSTTYQWYWYWCRVVFPITIVDSDNGEDKNWVHGRLKCMIMIATVIVINFVACV